VDISWAWHSCTNLHLPQGRIWKPKRVVDQNCYDPQIPASHVIVVRLRAAFFQMHYLMVHVARCDTPIGQPRTPSLHWNSGIWRLTINFLRLYNQRLGRWCFGSPRSGAFAAGCPLKSWIIGDTLETKTWTH
jgi:hypothetical protein